MDMNTLPKLSVIRVEKLRLRAYIGFVDWEQVKLQDIVISYAFKYNTAKATQSDDVSDAVDYKTLTKQIIDMIDNQSFRLIEYVAEKVYQFILDFNPVIQDIEVKIEKPYALRFSDNVLVEISGKDRYNTAIIALGSNIAPKENFEKALELIKNLGIVIQRTEFIETKPLKYENQANFLNGAILLLTQKSLWDLKFELKQIEVILGRVRTENKNAPRTIDLDLTTFNNFIVDTEISELPFLIDFIKYLRPELVSKI